MQTSLLLLDHQKLAEFVLNSSVDSIKEKIEYHVHMANLKTVEFDSKGISLEPSQHAHLSLVSQIFVLMNASLQMIESMLNVLEVPFVLLVITPQANLMFHPFLLYARHVIRKANKSCEYSEDYTHETKFIESALNSLLNSSAKSNSEMHTATCCQMAYEIGKFNFVMGNYAHGLELLTNTFAMIGAFSILENSTWIDFNFIEVETLIEICTNLSNHPDDKEVITIENLSHQLLKFKRYNFQDIKIILLQDALSQKLSLGLKRILMEDAILSDQGISADLIRLCIALHASYLPCALKDTELQEGNVARPKTILMRIQSELAQANTDTATLLQFIDEIYGHFEDGKLPAYVNKDEWKEAWQISIYAISIRCIDVKQEQAILNSNFMLSFTKHVPIKLAPSAYAQGENRLSTAATLDHNDAIIRELILTDISKGEGEYIPALTGMIGAVFRANKNPILMCPILLNLAENAIKQEFFQNASQLASMAELCLPSGLQPPSIIHRIQLLKSTSLISQVLEQLRLMDVLTQSNEINTISSQLLDSIEAATPSDLKTLREIVVGMLDKNKRDIAFAYVQRIQSLQTLPPAIANEMFNLGRIIILFSAIFQTFRENGIDFEGGRIDDIDLNALPQSFRVELLNFSSQIPFWIGSGSEVGVF